MGGSGSGRRPNEEARIAVLYFLGIHNKGATVPELMAYTDLPYTTVLSQITCLKNADLVYRTKPDSRTVLWHLKPQPSLTPAANPGRIPSRAHTRSR